MQEIVERLGAARQAAFQGRYDEAHHLASEVRRSYPHCLIALRLLAWTEFELKHEGAYINFQACRASDPLDAMAEVGLAMVAERNGEAQSALWHFLRAFELDAGDQRIRLEIKRLGGELPETRLADGLTALKSGLFELAAEDLRAATSAAPTDAAAKLGLAHALWRLGAREQVASLCSSILAATPHCLDALIYAVAAELAMGRTLRTRELLTRVEMIDPGYQLSRRLLDEAGVTRVIQGGIRSPNAATSTPTPRA